MSDLPSFSRESVVRNVRLPGRNLRFDITVLDGTVSKIAPHQLEQRLIGDVVDGRGDLAIPAFVDGHAHLDKTFLGIDWIAHTGSDDVRSRIDVEKSLRRVHADTLSLRAGSLAAQMLRYGTTALRTHVDIDETNRLSSLETILTLRAEMRELIDIQIVAFPQSGLRVHATVLEDLDAALRAGANVLGGLDPTTIDGDAEFSLDLTFSLAARHAVGVDLHLHETGETGAAVIEGMCRRAKDFGLQNKVVVSHGFCLADLPPARLHAVADAMVDAGVSLMTSVPGPGRLVPVAELMARGVSVFMGSDNVRDSWAPTGNGDMLDRARLLSYRADFRTDKLLALALDCVTRLPASILGFAPRGPSIGSQADIVLMPSPSIEQTVCDVPTTRRVIRKGRVVAQSQEPSTVDSNRSKEGAGT